MTATQPILDEDVAKVVPGVVDTVVGENIAVINPADDQIHILNATAAAIWSAIPITATVGELIAEVAQQVGRPPEAVAQDIRSTLADFVRADLITVGLANFDLGPPDFMVDVHHPARPAHITSRRRPHAALFRVLDQMDWLATTGPVLAAGAAVIIRTNEPLVAHELATMLSELPIAPEPGEQDEDPRGGPPTTHASQEARTPDPRRAYDPRNEPRTTSALVEALPWAITATAAHAEGTHDATPIVISALTKAQDRRWRHRLYIDGAMRWKGDSPESLANMLRTELNRIAVEHTRDHILMHAGAVERDGVVIAITGPSGHGKSTLTAALVKRGFSYVTDEVLAFEPDTLDVLAFPKAFDLDAASRHLLGLVDIEAPDTHGHAKASIPPRALGEISTGGRLGLVVLLGDPKDTTATPQRSGTQGEDAQDDGASPVHSPEVATLIELLAGVFRESFTDLRTLETLASLERRVALVRLDRMDLDDACTVVIEAFEGQVARSIAN